MSRFNVILIGLLALPGTLLCMENSQLSLSINKQPKSFNQYNFPKKKLTARVGSALSIQNARQSVEENPEEWVLFFSSSHGEHVDTLKPLLYCSGKQLGEFGIILGLDEQNTSKIFTRPFSNALEEINTLQTFQKRAKKLSLNELMKMPSDQIGIVGHLDNHFIGDVVTVDVDRNQWDLIAFLPKNVKRVFHNNEEFYTASLMRSTTDKIVHVGVEAAKGTVIGAGAGAIISLGVNCGIDKVLVPAAQQYIITMLKNHATFAAYILMTGKAHQRGMRDAHKKYSEIVNDDKIPNSSVLTEVPKKYFESASKAVINVESLKQECKLGRFAPTAFKHLKDGGTPMSEDKQQKALGKSVKAAQTGGFIGGVAGATYGLYTMNDPIVTKSISKI